MSDGLLLYGRNVLKEAILAKAPISKIFVETHTSFEFVRGLQNFDETSAELLEGIPRECQKESHQGIAFLCSHPFYTRYDFNRLKKHRLVLLCNHLEDVHNLGSIARSAAAFGASLIVHEDHGSAQLTPAVVKASAGCAFRVKFMKLPDLHRAFQSLRKAEFKIFGLDGSRSRPSLPLSEFQSSFPCALVLGSEAEGVEGSLLEKCDALIRVEMTETVDSLNVSHAAAIVLHQIFQQSQLST
ncbi:MAG: RNA methyltransferase [Bradymonadales bacterium]|nr:MAG: RNA methyltransferase [Bradymonadales bacterium]